jgi:transcription elongation factor GreA
MDEKVHYLTDEGRARLEEELHHLRTVRRVEIAESIGDAKREGDVSENAGYEDAKHEQAFVEGRIAELEALLRRAVRIGGNSGDTVSLGCRVTICEEGLQPETYHIVGSAEADPTAGRISNECPMGQALMGHHPGEQVSFRAPGGTLSIRIVKVE